MSKPSYSDPEAIVSTDWLADHLADPTVRIFDCTVYLHHEEGTSRPYTVESGQADYETAHIPGAAFLDLQDDFSDAESPYRFTLMSPDATAHAFAAQGVGVGHRIVLYARKNMQWATRFWWMLRWVGFDNAAILDGGFDRWEKEGRPVKSGTETYAAAQLSAQARADLFVGKDEMQAAIGATGVCSINALSPELHTGSINRYGRPGRIPDSVNVPASSLLDPETLCIKPAAEVQAAFDAMGAKPDNRILTYCGGGIAATLDAFLLHQLGYTDIGVYDNSMNEWATTDALPMDIG